MADPILVPIPDLSPAPENWSTNWLLAIANPATKRAYRLPGDEFTKKVVEQGGIAEVRNSKFYVAGRGNPGDPAAGASVITDATLQGYTFSGVNLRGTGDLIPGQEYIFNAIDTISFNSLDPENPGQYFFNEGDVIKVTFEPKISSYVSAPGSTGKMYSGVKTYNASGNILPGDFQKLQQIVATSQPVSLTLPPGEDYPPGVVLTITTNMVNTFQSTILTSGSDVIYITAAGKSKVILGVDEQLRLVWDDDGDGTKGWYVDFISDSYRMIGKWAFSYLPLPNAIKLDGSLISKFQYPRAVDLVERLQALYAGAVVNEATWQGNSTDPLKNFRNRTKWSLGPDDDHLRCPDWQGLFPRVLPGNRAGIDIDRGNDKDVPGSYEGHAMIIHDHVNDPNGAFNKLGARAADVDGTATPGNVDSVNPGKEYRVGEMEGTWGSLWGIATIKPEGQSQYENRSINGGLFAYGYI